jgi:hypothetical protein
MPSAIVQSHCDIPRMSKYPSHSPLERLLTGSRSVVEDVGHGLFSSGGTRVGVNGKRRWSTFRHFVCKRASPSQVNHCGFTRIIRTHPPTVQSTSAVVNRPGCLGFRLNRARIRSPSNGSRRQRVLAGNDGFGSRPEGQG